MMNMMFGNNYGGMMDGWGTVGGLVGTITLLLIWALMIATIAALWAWYKKNR